MNTKFVKVEGLIKSLDVEGSICTLDRLTEWIRMEYARDLYWVKERRFEHDVDIPDEEVTFDEYQTEEGQKRYWNHRLKTLIEAKENGRLLDKEIESYMPHLLFVVNFGGTDVFITIKDDNDNVITNLNKLYMEGLSLGHFKFEDATEEYQKIVMESINPAEIEEYVDTHTPDEIEQKYATTYFRNINDTSSMWEL